ncbi:protein fem-1 homolog C isoform X2 [Lepeophtheirus salmonis]|uniref:Protein fem1 homolog CG6966like [Nasonia vitripennis] n=2 Tax=Lepeophtheirus salmonis TaxID=72036 RepID=A0A0K2VAH3_LEPSM|nr:protein fem-1 homolog C-like [Lepeophtheirus salmonis]XP_040584019.1 protein fem-1 homolog C-like [Lepeophtheirus salmonis]XP_040584020.1 protein fem-1 homolog C-like [Lepeophtheirus salmonis]XP_040584021.1 protein fem-1 homolog C-like [Lepeophtheirus salmonis]
MWLGNSASPSSSNAKGDTGITQKEALFADLYQEVKCAAPSAQLSYSLRSRIERCDKSTRREITSKVKDGTSPLFIACKKGNVEIVEYLVTTCSADIEQKGVYEVQDDNSVHKVTPLWCAAVAGKVKVVEVLVNHGANVNCESDTGSTPVRSACFMTHLEIVKILVLNNADIQKPNYNGGTCLINSVQSVELCEFLLKHGADVNAQDIQCKTALHYAIQEHRSATTKLLLQYGAIPFLKSRYGDDALQTACLKGAWEIFDYLVDHLPYSPERVANCFELLGSTFLDEHHDSQKTIQYWKAACDIREKFGLKKPLTQNAKNNYTNMREFVDWTELESVALDLDAMRMQSLLICERVLGSLHKDTIYRIIYRGAAYADSLQYQYCIDLWKYALELRITKDSILFFDTCYTAQALVKLLLDVHEKNSQGIIPTQVRLKDVVSIIELLIKDVALSSGLLKVAPVYIRQRDSHDQILCTITNLLYLVTQLPNGEIMLSLELRKKIHHLVHNVNPTTADGSTLLHLTVSESNVLKTQNIIEEGHYSFFPNLEVLKILVECGANVNAMNSTASTPLHIAAVPQNYRTKIIELLLKNGAHIDIRDFYGVTPCRLLKDIGSCLVNPLKYTTLKCLAAQVISRHNLPFQRQVPAALEAFIDAH